MSAKQQSILLGSLVTALLSTSYLGLINVLCCAGVIVGGIVAVWHYTSENELTIPAGEGAAMGALAGLVGGIIAFGLEWVLGLVGVPGGQEIWQDFFASFIPMDEMTPEQREQMEAQQAMSDSPVMMVVGFAIGVVVSALFGAIGGAIGASIFKKGGPSAPAAPASDIV